MEAMSGIERLALAIFLVGTVAFFIWVALLAFRR